jgi:hypothetical protein
MLGTDRESGPLRLRHALRLRLISLHERHGVLGYRDHLARIEDWVDTAVVEIEPAGEAGYPRAWAIWNTALPGAIRTWKPADNDRITDAEPTDGVWRGKVPLPQRGRDILGDNAWLEFTVTGREKLADVEHPEPAVAVAG